MDRNADLPDHCPDALAGPEVVHSAGGGNKIAVNFIMDPDSVGMDIGNSTTTPI
jgi:hypothetical protein